MFPMNERVMFCPVVSLLALATADNAFKEDGIQRPEDLAIQWKPES